MGSPDDALTRRLVDLSRSLRQHGIAVGPSESADAAAACAALGVSDRGRLRAGIAAAMLRREGDREIFDQLFDIYFPAGVGDRQTVGEVTAATGGAEVRAAAEQLRDDLATALATADERELDRLAARAVAELGALANDSTMGGYSASQTLDRLAPQTAIAAALQRARDGADTPAGSGEGGGGSGSGSGGADGTGSPWRAEELSDRFDRDEIRSRVAAFRRRVEREATRRNIEARGTERISRYGVRDPLERKDFLLTGREEAVELQSAIRPLARKLAARLSAKQRRHSRGAVDVRRTLRRAMSTGGVPIRPAYKYRHRSRADIVLLCDMSGSVSGFSRFTMLLLQALSTQFRRVRFFGFVNICDDITDLVVGAEMGEDIRTRVAEQATIARWHGSSDYGSALEDFVDRWLGAVGPRSTVLVLGDARTNGSDPKVAALRTITEHARQVVWLNPERSSAWDTGDSVASRYGEVVDMHECRNVEQLRQFVSRSLPV
ncbi:VWA domain-containing protein [Marihabitans asiaticum]|uniref:VWA domain containing CoxE-like protein n=1 Tax=Marihabitans asiaticum TaxID=415218 RepID=A0A560WCW8_9MICO|nr:VWA domain-containing protein [Marihabitans asiaticum]TWD15468.1 hypothetical protein FB557_0978 [Marihabitans asiaticum]